MSRLEVMFLLCLITLSNCNSLRQKRQYNPFTRFICGVAPYRFSSDVPCNFYRTCTNGGFMINLNCQTNETCRQQNMQTACIDGCCCTVPRFENSTGDIPPVALPLRDMPATSTRRTSSASTAQTTVFGFVFPIFLTIKLLINE
ncbi:Endothelial differentiation-related factor 1 [Aphelenchoides bicaudatus]|nr:Endothelial differentiation-related factor 1 [Aphelenchoides bicaudatus]